MSKRPSKPGKAESPSPASPEAPAPSAGKPTAGASASKGAASGKAVKAAPADASSKAVAPSPHAVPSVKAAENAVAKPTAKPAPAAEPTKAKAPGKGKKAPPKLAMNLSQPGPRAIPGKPAPFSRVLANAKPPTSAPAPDVRAVSAPIAGTPAGAEQRENIEDLINSVLDAAEKDPSIIEGDDLPDLPARPLAAGSSASEPGQTKAKPAAGPSNKPEAPGIRSMLGAAASGAAPVLETSEHGDAEADDSDAEATGEGDESGAAGGQTLSSTLDLRPAALRDVKTMSQLHAERQSRFVPTTQPTMHPRKVRGGVKLSSKEGPVSVAWSAARWMRLVEDCAPNENLTEGLEYARNGQTKTLLTGPGLISARVQGRMPFAYTTEIRLPPLTFQQWDQALDVMVKEARPLAALLAGEVPQNIEDCFTPLRLQLFPSEPAHISLSCSCHQSAALVAQTRMRALGSGGPSQFGGGTPAVGVSGVAENASGGSEPQPPTAGTEGSELSAQAAPSGAGSLPSYSTSPWCKHVCCVMALVAERLAHDTFLIFHLRGLLKDDLLERLRQKRAVSASGRSNAGAMESSTVDHSVPVYQPQIIGITDTIGAPLDQSLEGFWEAPATAEPQEPIELRMEPPAVSHPLLRRLGSSPFQGARFPLVGLLATCYESIGQRMFLPQVPRLLSAAAQASAAALPPGASADGGADGQAAASVEPA